MSFLVSMTAAIIAVLFVNVVFGPLPSWALIPIALCISIPVSIWLVK